MAFQYLLTIFCLEGDAEASGARPQLFAEKEELQELGSLLPTRILTPVSDIIRYRHHLIFIPSHPIRSFPFSAAMLNEEPLFRTKAVSQAPSLAKLRMLSASNGTIRKPKIPAIARSGRRMD